MTYLRVKSIDRMDAKYEHLPLGGAVVLHQGGRVVGTLDSVKESMERT